MALDPPYALKRLLNKNYKFCDLMNCYDYLLSPNICKLQINTYW